MGKYTIYAVDFDGTLCESEWPGIGAPNTKLIEHLIKRRNQGAKLILWTCRNGERLQQAVEWCRSHGLEFDAVNENLPEMIEKYGGESRKIFAHCYIDDMAVDKEKYGLPFRAKKRVDESVLTTYPIDSEWVLVCNNFECPVKVAEISECGEMTVESISDTPNYRYYRCRREIEWFADKLFPLIKEE